MSDSDWEDRARRADPNYLDKVIEEDRRKEWAAVDAVERLEEILRLLRETCEWIEQRIARASTSSELRVIQEKIETLTWVLFLLCGLLAVIAWRVW